MNQKYSNEIRNKETLDGNNTSSKANRIRTEASAFVYSNHPGTRRAGWGLHTDQGETRNGPVHGRNQEVCRAELRAVVEGIEFIRGDVEIIS